MTTRDRLFHVLLTLGAGAVASTACGDESGAESGGSGGAGGGGASSGGSLSLGLAGAVATAGTGGGNGMAGHAAASDGGDVPACKPACEGGTAPTCEHSEQLFCESYVPVPTYCYCDTTAPLGEENCPGRQFSCMSYDPPMGCSCVYITGPR